MVKRVSLLVILGAAGCSGLIGLRDDYYDAPPSAEGGASDANDDRTTGVNMDASLADARDANVTDARDAADARGDAADAGPSDPVHLAPASLQLWLTADRGLTCTGAGPGR